MQYYLVFVCTSSGLAFCTRQLSEYLTHVFLIYDFFIYSLKSLMINGCIYQLLEGRLYSPVHMKNLVTIFKGCYFPRFCVLISSSFHKIDTKNFKTYLSFFRVVKLGKIPPSARLLNCVNTVRSQVIEAIIRGISKCLLENVAK